MRIALSEYDQGDKTVIIEISGSGLHWALGVRIPGISRLQKLHFQLEKLF